MAIYQQLKGLLKSEFIQMKRSIFLSLAEILCPIILLILYFFIRLSFKKEKEKYESIFENDLYYIANYSTNLTNYINSNSQNNIQNIDENTPIPYYYFLAQCRFTKHIAIIGKDFPEKLKNKISSHFWELDNDDNDFNENEFFKEFSSVEEFEKYMTSKNYGKDDILYPKICFGISQTDKFKFGIHYNTIDINNENSNDADDLLSQESPHIPDMKSNKNEKIGNQGNLKFFKYYKNSGYLMTMKILYDYILQEITNDPNAEINFSVIAMKYDEILKDSFHRFLSILGFFIIISYSIPFAINIYKEIHFRETKKKEYLKSMGVKEIIFFIKFFIRCFIINIFQSILCSLFTRLILRQSQYIYLFFIFLLYGLVIFSMTYFFQSFLQQSRMGVIISLLIYCIMSFFYLPLDSPAANKSFAYFICIIFPPANLLLGFNNFYIFEKEFSPLKNRVNLDLSQITISLMIVFLFISFIIYLILGYVISQFICYDYGVNKKLFCSKKETVESNRNNNDRNNNNYRGHININDEYSKSSGRNMNKYYNNSKSTLKRKNISNPPKQDQLIDNNNSNNKNKNYSNIINNNINSINNININININNKDLQDFGKTYIKDDNDMDISEKESIDEKKFKANKNNIIDTESKINIENEKLKTNIKNLGYDYINSLTKNMPQDILDKKRENLKQNIEKININDINSNSNNNTNNNTNPFILEEDDCELDLENQKQTQEIRNKRRLKESTIFNLKPKETIINENMKISHIGYILGEPLLSKSLYKLFDNKKNNLNEIKLDKKEIKANEEDVHVGSRLEIKNIKKNYENEKELVLNNLSFNLYENELFALLGQNGAGKSTFISILSGLIEANSGSIRYKRDKKDSGLEVRDPQGNVKFRKILGVCHQNNNVLYEDLTVKENLEIFCLFKYDKSEHGDNEKYYIEREIRELIDKFELRKEQDELAKNLSGGLKRRLCIAIAFCGRSKVIILDEPTGGIDILNRKKLWDILKKLKTDKKIILLITHFMEEATFLADKIGILKNGELICSGTSRELIDNYGNYITIQINHGFDDRTRSLLKYIKDNILLKNIPNENNSNNKSKADTSVFINNDKIEYKRYKERIEIKIPTRIFDFSKSYNLLETIEKVYQFKDYRILQDQLEDAFINAIKDPSKKDDKEDYETLSKINQNIERYTSFEKFKNELKILIFKRGYETLRDKKSFILEILFPILLTLIACFTCYFEALEKNKKGPIELNLFGNETQTIYYEFANISDYQKYQKMIVKDKNEEDKIKNYNFMYSPNIFGKTDFNINQNLVAYLNSIDYINKNMSIVNNSASFYLINADKEKHKYEFASFINIKQRHASITYTNYILNNIIKYEIKENPLNMFYLYNISIMNCPIDISYKDKNDKKSRNGFVLAFYVAMALALIPSNFITIIIREKENKSKHLQILSGLSIYTYWINNYIFELIKYYVVVGICLLIILIFKFYEKYMALLYVFYGPALVSFTYVISYFIESEGIGQVVVLIINLIFGALCGSAVLILRTNKDMKKLGIALSYIFRFIPSFCISFGYMQLMSKKILFVLDYYKTIDDIEIIQKKIDDSSSIIKDGKYIINDITYLIIEIFLYTVLLIFLEKKDYFLWKLGYLKNDLGQKAEIELSRNYYSEIRNRVDPLNVIQLKKSYRNKQCFFNCCCNREKKQVLTDVTFSVKNGECFGLLGSNGEGKTTSFKCLCKEIRPDSGVIKINNINVFDFSIKDKPIIGYCPQFDSIFEFLTVTENLQYYGRLKGINEYSLDNVINIILGKLNLKKYSDKLSGELSGGNKRKLSVGISIISKPCIILLDEPSTGMDPYTRRLLLQLLHRAYLQEYYNDRNEKIDESPKSIVLTTHSIEEAESLCDKIGILVGGKFSAKGKINSILQDHSKGIELNIEFKKPSPDILKIKYGNILKDIFRNIDDIKKFLNNYGKKEYCEFLKRDHFGRDILKVMITKKQINKFTILRWIEYLDYLLGLTNKIKTYFDYVYCVEFKLNNFILRIKNNNKSDKNDNYIFGLIEEFKNRFYIEEYSYTLTTLENIFIDCNEYNRRNRNTYSNENKYFINIPL